MRFQGFKLGYGLVFLGAFAACTGSIPSTGSDGDGGEDEPGPSTPGGPGGRPGDLGGPGSSTSGVAASSFARLSSEEYVNAVGSLFPALPMTLQTGDLPVDDMVAGFKGAPTRGITDEDLTRYANVAASVAEAASSKADDLLAPCKRGGAQDEACTRQWLAKTLPLAWRRDVDTKEIDQLITKVFSPNHKAQGFERAFEAVIMRMLLSAHFLYKHESGDAANGFDGEVIKLSDPSLANRLAFFLWRSPADERLRQLAKDGNLSREETLRKEVERMLDDPRGLATVRSFSRQWLHVEEARFPAKDHYPMYTPGLRNEMFEEMDRFLDHVMRKGEGHFSDLFIGKYTFATETLAKIYGVSGGGGDYPRVDLSSKPERSGLLTQALYLAHHSHYDDNRQAIYRGLYARTQLLCNPIPLPEAGVDLDPKIDRLKPGNSCSACHLQFETIGRGFENFDGIGRHRTEVDGKPVESMGRVTDLDGEDYTFSSPSELGSILANSDEARKCLMKQWFRFALGRSDGEEDEASLARIDDELKKSGSVRQMLQALVLSPAFRHRREEVNADSCQ